MLGGRVRKIAVGSALVKPEVKEFIKVVLCVELIEGYG